jgi:hypothetical protein
MMTWKKEVHLLAVFADQRPANNARSCNGGGTVDSLDLAGIARLVSDKVAAVR